LWGRDGKNTECKILLLINEREGTAKVQGRCLYVVFRCRRCRGTYIINKYTGGAEYISKHSDDETGLDPTAGVIALSLGQVRTFRIRDKATNQIDADIPTHADKIIQMAGKFQREFTHEIPVEKRPNTSDGVRYSFTFRKHHHVLKAARTMDETSEEERVIKKSKADC